MSPWGTKLSLVENHCYKIWHLGELFHLCLMSKLQIVVPHLKVKFWRLSTWHLKISWPKSCSCLKCCALSIIQTDSILHQPLTVIGERLAFLRRKEEVLPCLRVSAPDNSLWIQYDWEMTMWCSWGKRVYTQLYSYRGRSSTRMTSASNSLHLCNPPLLYLHPEHWVELFI